MPVRPAADIGAASAADFASASDEQFALALGLAEVAPEPPVAEVAPPAAPTEPALPAHSEETPQAQVGTQVQPEATPLAEAEPAEPPKPLLTKFALKDEQGELDPEDAASRLRFDFKANGKDYTDVPLDKVVLLAQMGFSNEAREQQVLASKQFVSQAQEQLNQAASVIERQNVEIERLLQDPLYADKAREQWAVANSPEQRAARLEQELRQRDEASTVARADDARRQFVQQVLWPTLSPVMAEVQGVVSEQEVLGQYTMLTAPLLVRGAVPPERLPMVEHLVKTELVPWIRGRATVKSLDTQKATAGAKAEVTAAKEKAALAKRQLARAVAPPPTSAAPTATQPKQKTYESATSWLEDFNGIVSAQPPA